MKPLHSKTASKAGSSLWIPLGRGAPPLLAKNKTPLKHRSCWFF
jgi:hypothetical protein